MVIIRLLAMYLLFYFKMISFHQRISNVVADVTSLKVCHYFLEFYVRALHSSTAVAVYDLLVLGQGLPKTKPFDGSK